MGTWGTGLYSGDFAMDLRSTVGAVVRLPFDPDRLVDVLCETEPAVANNPIDDEHTTFWLVLADQFAKRGIDCERVRKKALGIIAAGDDIAALERLGMQAAGIRKRRGMLDELRTRIVARPAGAKARAVIRKPQPLLMETGDVVIYPTCGGACINPYYASRELNRRYTKDGPVPWIQDGWGAMVIIDCGRAFGFLSWYRPVTLAAAQSEKPSVDLLLRGELLWRLRLPGVCSASHFRKMELDTIGVLPISPERLHYVFPELRPGVSAAVKDISIANSMSAAPDVPGAMIPKAGEAGKGMARTLLGLEQILIAQWSPPPNL